MSNLRFPFFRYVLTSEEDDLGGDVVWRIYGGHLGYRNGMILAILNLLFLRCIPSGFSLIQLKVWEEMSFEEFQNGCLGGHLGYRNGTILAILNLCVAQLDLWFGRRCVLKNFKLDAMTPSWISEWNDFNNSASLCHSDPSHRVSAQSGKRYGSKNFKMATVAAILDIGTERF